MGLNQNVPGDVGVIMVVMAIRVLPEPCLKARSDLWVVRTDTGFGSL